MKVQCPKAPGTNSSMHCCCCEIALPVHCQWDEPHHLSLENFPKFLTKFPKLLLVWSTTQSQPNHRNRSITKMVKTYFIFTHLTKQYLNVQERKVHEGGSISWAMICIILTMCLLLDINTYSSSLPVHTQWPLYPWQERLYTSNSHITYSSNMTATIQPNTIRGNFEANRRNYLYFQLRYDPGGNMEANPYTQDMDLVPFPNIPGISEYPHKTLHPRYNHRSATTITTTSNWPNASFCNFQSIQIYGDNRQHASSTFSTFMSQSFNLPSGTGRKL